MVVKVNPLKKGIKQVKYWVERQQLRTELKQKIEDSCRVLIITGITGIGKTTLAKKLVFDLQKNSFKNDQIKFHQENFDNQNQASNFSTMAIHCLEKWGQFITPEESKNTEQILNHLVNFLINNPYLLVLDALDLILKENPDQWWVQFFHLLLASSPCQSRLIVTISQLPEQIFSKDQNYWYCINLKGLQPLEQLKFFEKKGLNIKLSTGYKPYLKRIGKAYEGHPLILQVIAGEIMNQPFFGNVITYWHQYGQEIETIESSSNNLKWRVQSQLEIIIHRLEKNNFGAYLLLCLASIYRCEVTPEYWLSLLKNDYNEEQQKMALAVLRDRYFFEESSYNQQYLIKQHYLIRSVALEHLKKMD